MTVKRDTAVRTLTKVQRQHRVGRLLAEQPVTSQGQLVDLLAAEGVVATQATVSRDLDELGAVKVRVPGVVGTVAGDDTLIVVVAEEVGGEQAANQMREYAGL
jgi:arginine repressor